MPERSQQTTLRNLGDAGIRRVVERYVRALEEADVDAVVSMLAEEATWSMPPLPAWYRGHDAISRFLMAGPFTVRWRHLVTHANGQPAVACYVWHEGTGAYLAEVLDVLTLDGEQITAVTAFIDPSLFPRFKLPTQLAADSERAGRPWPRCSTTRSRTRWCSPPTGASPPAMSRHYWRQRTGWWTSTREGWWFSTCRWSGSPDSRLSMP